MSERGGIYMNGNQGRTKQKIVKFLEIEDIRKFEEPLTKSVKNALNKQVLTATDKIAIRDFAVINLVYACALRISEACKLKLKDVDLDKKEMIVFDGKGGDRYVPIPEPTIQILKEWLEIRPEWKNNPYFFTNIKGTTRPGEIRPITSKYYNQLFNKLATITGVKLKDGKNPHPHTLRHSRAMEIYDNKVQLEIIQALLGHKNISTTQIYARVRNERVMEAQQAITKGLVTI
jgi:integrase/recombinase XerC